MNKQVTNHLMMIRPVAFYMNDQTAVNNYYQQSEEGVSAEEIQDQARSQFDGFVEKLRAEGVDVTVFEDTLDEATPDSIFPNNWISFHQEGNIRLYPMYAENRRKERREDIIDGLREKFTIDQVIDHAHWEAQNSYLEGTENQQTSSNSRILTPRYIQDY